MIYGTDRNLTLRGTSGWNGDLQPLEPLFDLWTGYVDRYARRVNKDVPYGQGRERALLGILGAAAWSCGWEALEEFPLQKLQTEQSNRESGRADLWLHKENGPTYYVEAKIAGTDLDKDCRGNLEAVCERAMSDARRVVAYDDEDHACLVGLGFLNLHLSIDGGPPESQIADAVSNFRNEDLLEGAGLAWCFPGCNKGSDDVQLIAVVAAAGLVS